MSNISKEELVELGEYSKRIGISQLHLKNAQLVVELEMSKFENYKLNLFRKYDIKDEMYIDKDGEIKSVEKNEDEQVEIAEIA